MTDAYQIQCAKCGKVFHSGVYHFCRMGGKSDLSFARIIESNLPLLDDTTGRLVSKFHAELVDMEDQAIVDAVIRAAQDEGITTLCLLDKRFVLDAIREKMERMRWE